MLKRILPFAFAFSLFSNQPVIAQDRLQDTLTNYYEVAIENYGKALVDYSYFMKCPILQKKVNVEDLSFTPQRVANLYDLLDEYFESPPNFSDKSIKEAFSDSLSKLHKNIALVALDDKTPDFSVAIEYMSSNMILTLKLLDILYSKLNEDETRDLSRKVMGCLYPGRYED